MRQTEIKAPGYQRVVHFEDDASGLNAIISVHSTVLGPALGGCRMFAYPSFDEGLSDVLRLSRGMTFKNALAGIPFGGGKSIIFANPKTDKSDALFDAFGAAVESYGGSYYTAEDSGITEADLTRVHTVTEWVGGLVRSGSKGGNPSPYTAYGVWRGVQAAARFKLGAQSLDGVKVIVLGLGAVGMELARLMHEEGAKLIVADIDDAKVEAAVKDFGATRAKVDEAHAQSADIFAPCALGGAINANTIGDLKVKAVAGAANNQLNTPEMGDRLVEKGILYAPDYLINAGGVISVGLELTNEWEKDKVLERLDGIGDTLMTIFERAQSEGAATHIIADKLAEEIIEQKRRAA